MHLVASLCLFFISLSSSSGTEINIIPYPADIKSKPGVFLFHKNVQISIPKSDPTVRYAAEYLVGLFKNSFDTPLTITEYDGAAPDYQGTQVLFSFNSSITHDEGYLLTISPRGITIQGKTAHGMFHAVTSFRQLLPESLEQANSGISKTVFPLPCLQITDYPRYKYRGFMLDVGRHFSTVENVKKMIDLLVLHKMNTLHFHLTEDQGWRIEIKKYPKLTEIGAWRDQDHGANDDEDQRVGFVPLDDPDNSPQPNRYGGFYTQDEIKDIVDYATKRFIRVQPEIETPGHAVAAIASYPELSCSGAQVSVICDWGIFSPVFCSKEYTMGFLEDVFNEVMDLFPSQMLHIGGDECPDQDWSVCPNCTKRKEEENLSSYRFLHGYIIKRLEDCVVKNAVPRRLIGWDEIYHSGHLNQSTAVMVWQSSSLANEIVRNDHDIVLTPMSHCYFDFGEANDAAFLSARSASSARSNHASPALHTYGEAASIDDMDVPADLKQHLRAEAARQAHPDQLPPKERTQREQWAAEAERVQRANGEGWAEDVANAPGGGLANVYSFDPQGLTFRQPEQEKAELVARVLGGQANLWTEHLPQQSDREFNTFPRLAAMCEALWTPKSKKDWDSFHKRVSFHLRRRYDALGVKYNPANLLREN